MTDEPLMIWQFTTAMACLTSGTSLYSWGGFSGKWKRRFVGSAILSGGFIGLCLWRGLWNPWLLTSFPAIVTAFCLPYGAESTFPKIIKRTSVVLAVLLSGLAFCLINGGNAWWVMIPHFGIGLWAVYLAVKNPLFARAEEGFVCLLMLVGLYMYPFIVH